MKSPLIEQSDEYPYETMITITLSPELLKLPSKTQLNKTYKICRYYFDTGMGCFEFTKKGNIHYHIKSQDNEFKKLCFYDDLKSITFSYMGRRYPAFGFVHISNTNDIKQLYDYDYLLKNDVISKQILKRNKIIDKENIWVYTPYIAKKKVKIEYGNLDPFSDEE